MMEQLSPRDQEIEEKTVTAVNILMSIKKKETKEPKTSTSCTQLPCHSLYHHDFLSYSKHVFFSSLFIIIFTVFTGVLSLINLDYLLILFQHNFLLNLQKNKD